MNIFWLVNIVLPVAAKAMHWQENFVGGWLSGQLEAIVTTGEHVTVCSPCTQVSEITRVFAGGAQHILVPPMLLHEKQFKELLADEKPDVVHIFGTEFSYAKHMLLAVQDTPCVVSIQGLISEYAKYYTDGLPQKYAQMSNMKKWLKHYIPKNAVLDGQQNFVLRGSDEIAALRSAKNVIGRTQWDKQCVMHINPELRYFHVNENLRDAFYTGVKWKKETCAPHTLFLSQGDYPIKGVHQLLKAMPRILKQFPDTKVFIGGAKPQMGNTWMQHIIFHYTNEYQGYLQTLIKQYKLEKHIVYTAPLLEKEMIQQYLSANVFLCPSAVENSSNSIGEAMILGVPVVATNRGGTQSILQDGREGILYDFEDTDALANAICRLFADDDLAESYGNAAKEHAQHTHDRLANTKALLQVYAEITRKE